MAALLLVGSSAYAVAQTAMPAMPGMGTGVVTLNLKAQNGSGETATATLAQAGDDVKVTVVTNGGGTDPQPIHIHTGTCAKLDPKPTYPLTTVQDGKSVTTLKDLKLSDLETGNYAINIHKSTTDIGTYVSCGDIPKLAKSM